MRPANCGQVVQLGDSRRRRVGIRRLRVIAPLLSLLLAGACTTAPAGTASEETPPPFEDCAALTAGPEPHRDSPATPADGSEARPLPNVQLPCFTSGATVALVDLRGPAVINLWASWCHPCRKELPALQRLAEAVRGRVHVVGVNTRDQRESAQSLAADLGLTFPNLVDRDELLRTGLGRATLPITLFVDGQSRIRHVYDSGALDDATLAGLLQRHLGVAMAP